MLRIERLELGLDRRLGWARDKIDDNGRLLVRIRQFEIGYELQLILVLMIVAKISDARFLCVNQKI